MKALVNWIVFVPVCLMSLLLMIFSGLAPDTITSLLSTDINGIAEIISLAVLGLFAVCFVVSFFNRKLSPAYLLKKNYVAGIAAVLSAFSLASVAAMDVTDMIRVGEYSALGIFVVAFTALSGVAMLFVALNHIGGVNTPTPVSILYLSLPLWCGVHLIDRFMQHTATPVAAAETLDLIMFVALALFFIYSMMIHAVIPVKQTVNYAVMFGFPTAVICLVYAVSQFFAVASLPYTDLLSYLPAISYALLGVYALSFTAEITFNAKTCEEQELVDNVTEETDNEDISYQDTTYDNFSTESDDASGFVNIAVSAVDDSEPVSDSEEDVQFNSFNYDEPIASAPAKIRVAEPDFDDVEDLEFNESSAEDIVAEELYQDAQKRDMNIDTFDPFESNRSEDEMVIDGEFENKSSFSKNSSNNGSKPKGPIEREAVMFDDDFILSIDNGSASDDAPAYDKNEDISAFILEKTEDEDDNQIAAKDNYNARLDEIDRLIISLQSGKEETQDED